MNIKMSTLIKMLKPGSLDGYDQGYNSAIIELLQNHCSFDEDNNEPVSEQDKIIACLQQEVPGLVDHSLLKGINWTYIHDCKINGYKLEAVKHIKDATKAHVLIGLKEAKYAMDNYFAM